MDPSQNKRKVSESSSPPTTPHPPKGARFFPSTFASPQTMPKRAPIPPLDYLNSPTLGAPSDRARTPTPSQPYSPQDASPPQGERTNSTTTLAEGEDTDMSDPDAHLGGVRDSMHAPRRDITPTPQAPQRLPTPTTQTCWS